MRFGPTLSRRVFFLQRWLLSPATTWSGTGFYLLLKAADDTPFMAISTLDFQQQVLNDLYRGLHQALGDIHPEQFGATLYLKPMDPSDAFRIERSFRIEGPEDLSVEARCRISQSDGNAHTIYVEIADGPSQQFRYTPSEETTEVNEPTHLGHTIAAFLLDEMERRLGRVLFQQSSSMGAGLQIPMLSLGQEGTIQHITEAAKRVLEYSSEASLNSCFFTHVHGDNLRQVMRDMADMVCHCRKYSQWLLRLRTGNDRWRWYRAKVRNHLDEPETFIQLRLHPL